MKNKKSKRIDFWVVFLWGFVALVLSLYFSENYLVSALFFFAIPAVFLSIRKKATIKKSALASLIFLIPLTIIIDYLAHKDGSWLNFSIIGVKVLNTYPIEDFLWGFIYMFYVFIFYEYFFDKDQNKSTVPQRFFLFNAAAAVISVLFVCLLALFPDKISISYFYLFLVVIFMIIMLSIILIRNRRIFSKIAATAIFFAPMSLMYEYVAGIKAQWMFPGTNFVGYVSLLGVSFPFEELMWIFFCIPAILSYYELFADDLK